MPAKNPYRGSLRLLTLLFFMWGFLTCLNDILIPQLKSLFILNYTEVMLVQFCFFAAYFIVSVPSGYFVERFSYQAGIVSGLTVAGFGCLLFYPAAEWLSYPLFLFAFFVLASGNYLAAGCSQSVCDDFGNTRNSVQPVNADTSL